MSETSGRERERRADSPRAPPRRFQGDTNLYGGEILAFPAAFSPLLPPRAGGDVDPEIGMPGATIS